MGNLLILSEAAKRTGLSAGHLRLLVSSKAVKGERAGKFWMVDTESLHAYMERSKARRAPYSDQSEEGAQDEPADKAEPPASAEG